MNKIPSSYIYFYCRCFTSELCIIDWSGGFCICSTFTALFMCDGMNMGLYFLSFMNYSPLCKDSLQQVVMFHIRSHHIDVCVQHVRETHFLLLSSPRPHLVQLQKKLWNIVTTFLKCFLCEYLFKCNFKSLSQTFSLTVPIWWPMTWTQSEQLNPYHLQETASLPSLFAPLTLSLSILILFDLSVFFLTLYQLHIYSLTASVSWQTNTSFLFSIFVLL